jgi:hypothetical protein
MLPVGMSKNCLGNVPGQLVRKWAGVQLFPSSYYLFFSSSFISIVPHTEISLSSLKLSLLSYGKKKKKRRIEEEDYGSTDFDVLFVDVLGFLKIFGVGLVWFFCRLIFWIGFVLFLQVDFGLVGLILIFLQVDFGV